MSTKSTIILTNDNEHWYNDCSEPITKVGEPYKDAIVMVFDKKNIRIDCNDDDSLVITLTNPNSEIYDFIALAAKVKRGY
jgi:hypothetical protein